MKGRHAQDKYRVQFYCSLCNKAMISLVSQLDDATMTDEIMRCIHDRAVVKGVYDSNGNVNPEYQDELEIIEALISQNERTGK